MGHFEAYPRHHASVRYERLSRREQNLFIPGLYGELGRVFDQRMAGPQKQPGIGLGKHFHSHRFQLVNDGFVCPGQVALQLFDVFSMPSLQQHIEHKFFGDCRGLTIFRGTSSSINILMCGDEADAQRQSDRLGKTAYVDYPR